MSYYRAALAAAFTGDLTSANRLVRCSLVLKENAPNASRLLGILRQHAISTHVGKQSDISKDVMDLLRSLVSARQYTRALTVRMPQTARAHNLRGLLFAICRRRHAARREFALTLTLDAGNDLARRALADIGIPKTASFTRQFPQIVRDHT